MLRTTVGNYLRDIGVFPMCQWGSLSYCRLRAGLPLYTLGVLPPYTGLCRILGGLGRQATQSTFLMQLHTYPPSDTLNNPSTGQKTSLIP